MEKINKKISRKLVLTIVVLQFFIVALMMPIVVHAEGNISIPEATSDFYVNDFADVFTEEEKSHLMENAVGLADEHDGIQVVVTTIKTLEGNSIEDYAVQMYNQYGIGKDDMGLLILLATEDRQIRVEVGKAMEAYINDSKAGRYIDNYAIPYLKENKFNEGLINLQEKLIEEVVNVIGKESATNVAVTPSSSEEKADFSWVFNVLIGLIVIFLIYFISTTIMHQIDLKRKKHQDEIDELNQKLEKAKQLEIEQTNLLELNRNSLYEKISNLSDEITSLQQELRSIKEEKRSLSNSYSALLNKYNTLQDRYSRAMSLHPSIDDDVSTMIEEEIRQKDMAAAHAVDSSIEEVINLPASKDIVDQLDNVISKYSRLSEKQKSYMQSDIKKLNQLHDSSLKLKQDYEKKLELERQQKCAAVAFASISAIITYISVGKAKDLKKLKEAKKIYDNLDSGSRSFFDEATADKLDSLIAEAEQDKREQDEAEERRRREEERRRRAEEEIRRREEAERRRRREEEHRRRMSSSSSRNSSHHSGFGGRSGGGGASRGF